jgi:hypothetical protein
MSVQYLQRGFLLTAAIVMLMFGPGSKKAIAAGVTIITHGLRGEVGGWILPMANQMLGKNAICYTIKVNYDSATGGHYLTYQKLSGPALSNSPLAEIIIKLDWSDYATLDSILTSSTDIADWVTPVLVNTNNGIPEFAGKSLVDLPIHLIGHSRGGSVASELARTLGAQGLWVDQVTFLDPHPIWFPYGDADVHVYSNVLFADDYFQDIDIFTDGQSVAGAYNRQLTSLLGAYNDNHKNVHVWYHGTIDLATPASYYDVGAGSVVGITEAMRQSWWNNYEQRGAKTGFQFSLLQGGNRLSSDEPDGPGTSRIKDGYNQWWDFGAGSSVNRTALPANNGNWPNVVKFNLAGTNLIAFGQSNAVTLYVQWAKPATSNATIQIYLDDDFNPYNGNEHLVKELTTSGNGTTQIGFGTISMNLNATNATAGVHSIFAKMTGGGRSRYLYAPEMVTVMSSFQPPTLTIVPVGSQVRVDVHGVAGQRIVLSRSSDFQSWQTLATNWLQGNVWSSIDSKDFTKAFYRALVQ